MWFQTESGHWTTKELEERWARVAKLEALRREFPWEVWQWVPTKAALEHGPPYWLFHDFEHKRLANYKTEKRARRAMDAYLRRGMSCGVHQVDEQGKLTRVD